MGIISVANGTQSATIDSLHTLSSQTGVGVYVLKIDTGNMVTGDTLEISIFDKVLSGGTLRLTQFVKLVDAQDVPNWRSDAIPVDVEISVAIKQTSGTGSSFPWKLLRA